MKTPDASMPERILAEGFGSQVETWARRRGADAEVARAARRASGLRASHPKISNETHPEYSSNWAGAVYNSAKVRVRGPSHADLCAY